jgi:hypothetical protein
MAFSSETFEPKILIYFLFPPSPQTHIVCPIFASIDNPFRRTSELGFKSKSAQNNISIVTPPRLKFAYFSASPPPPPPLLLLHIVVHV